MSNNYDTLRLIVGGRVRRAGLLIWPESGGLENTDVQLHLQIDCVDAVYREITCSTDLDGQTLKVELAHWQDALPMSKMEERKKVWSSPEFWNRPEGQAYELFDVTSDGGFGIGQGSVVTAVHLVKFADDQSEPTGVVIEFDSGARLWSAPAAHGNQVSANRQDFAWPTEIELVAII